MEKDNTGIKYLIVALFFATSENKYSARIMNIDDISIFLMRDWSLKCLMLQAMVKINTINPNKWKILLNAANENTGRPKIFTENRSKIPIKKRYTLFPIFE